MLEELGKDLQKIGLAGLGAAAILAEKGGELAKECLKRGEVMAERGRVVSEELKRSAEQAAEERRRRCVQENVSILSQEEREQLRRRLDELDAEETAAGRAEETETPDDTGAAED